MWLMKKVVFLSIAVCSLLFTSCASSKIEEQKMHSPARINCSISEKHLASESFVFLRLYDVIYDKPLRPGNFLRKPIRMFGKAPDGTAYVHSAISTVLKDDSFVGLSLSDNKNMARLESVQNLQMNDYMSTINGSKSRCVVLAVPCSKIERKGIGELLDYAKKEDSGFIYGITKNLTAAFGHMGNAKKLEHSRNFPIEFSFDPIPLDREPSEVFTKKTFVCSNFITFILDKTVERYRVGFLINGINPMGYTPVDLYYLDNIVELFECNFNDYDKALEEFLEQYPVFSKFMK